MKKILAVLLIVIAICETLGISIYDWYRLSGEQQYAIKCLEKKDIYDLVKYRLLGGGKAKAIEFCTQYLSQFTCTHAVEGLAVIHYISRP